MIQYTGPTHWPTSHLETGVLIDGRQLICVTCNCPQQHWSGIIAVSDEVLANLDLNRFVGAPGYEVVKALKGQVGVELIEVSGPLAGGLRLDWVIGTNDDQRTDPMPDPMVPTRDQMRRHLETTDLAEALAAGMHTLGDAFERWQQRYLDPAIPKAHHEAMARQIRATLTTSPGWTPAMAEVYDTGVRQHIARIVERKKELQAEIADMPGMSLGLYAVYTLSELVQAVQDEVFVDLIAYVLAFDPLAQDDTLEDFHARMCTMLPQEYVDRFFARMAADEDDEDAARGDVDVQQAIEETLDELMAEGALDGWRVFQL